MRVESFYTLTHVIHVIVNQTVSVLLKQKVVIRVTINKYVLSDIQSSPSVKQVLNVYLHVFVNVRCCIYNYLYELQSMFGGSPDMGRPVGDLYVTHCNYII